MVSVLTLNQAQLVALLASPQSVSAIQSRLAHLAMLVQFLVLGAAPQAFVAPMAAR
jgi:hypothetical protein